MTSSAPVLRPPASRVAAALLLALLLASCSPAGREFRETGTRADPLLRPGVRIVTYAEVTELSVRDYRYALRNADGETIDIATVADLRPHLAPIDTEERAVAYADILRLLFDGYEGTMGQPLLAAVLTPELTSRWGVREAVVARRTGPDSFEVVRPVAVGVPVPGWSEGSAAVLLLRERIGTDGSYRFEPIRVLETGPDAEAFVARRL